MYRLVGSWSCCWVYVCAHVFWVKIVRERKEGEGGGGGGGE